MPVCSAAACQHQLVQSAEPHRRPAPAKIAFVAGVGTLIAEQALELRNGGDSEWIIEIVTLALVALGVVAFIEPLLDRF